MQKRLAAGKERKPLAVYFSVQDPRSCLSLFPLFPLLTLLTLAYLDVLLRGQHIHRSTGLGLYPLRFQLLYLCALGPNYLRRTLRNPHFSWRLRPTSPGAFAPLLPTPFGVQPPRPAGLNSLGKGEEQQVHAKRIKEQMTMQACAVRNGVPTLKRRYTGDVT